MKIDLASIKNFTLSARHKKILRWAGYPLLAIFTFIIALHLTFPYGRVKGWVEEQASDKYTVSIAEVDHGFMPGSIEMTKIKIRPLPKKADDTPPAITIDELDLDVSLLGMLRGRWDVDVEATLGKGSVTGEISASKSGLGIDLSTRKLPLQHIPGLREAVGLPMEGGLNADLDIWLPRRRWREADGKIKLSCNGCTVGDGVAKIRPKKNDDRPSTARTSAREQFIGDGIEVPRLELGNLAGQVDIKAGKGTIKNFRGESVDGEMLIEGEIDFKDPFKNSTFPGCMKFKFAPDFHQREPKFANVPNLMGAGIQPDGFAHVRLAGTLGDLKWKPKLKCAEGGGEPGEGGRPVVTTMPERPTVEQPAAPPAPPPTEPVPPIAGAIDAAVPEAPPTGERRGIDDVKPEPEEPPPPGAASPTPPAPEAHPEQPEEEPNAP